MKVELVDKMGSDLSVVNSARVSFNKQSDELTNRDERLINYLAKHRHNTTFRHNQIQLRCEAPIFLARQLGKHQAGLSWNEVSRRYVDDAFSFFLPIDWRERPDASIKQGSGRALNKYDGANVESAYKDAVSDAMGAYEYMTERYDVAPELARMVLPQSMMTSWMWSGNLLAFAHVYKERSHPSAQVEAQVFAHLLDEVIRPLFPVAWSALVDVEEKDEV